MSHKDPSRHSSQHVPLYRAHPWHGVSPCDLPAEIDLDGPQGLYSLPPGAFNRVTVFIEMVPTDTVKYEVDKASGLLRLDRPQKYSSLCPAPYGFIPQTYCGERVGRFAARRTGRTQPIRGDGDPLDICVLTERPINHGGLLLSARPIGGYRMFDGDEADDKILAVLTADPTYGELQRISQCPAGLVDRLRHYFLSYKNMPGMGDRRPVEITDIYEEDEAREIIRLSLLDYRDSFTPHPAPGTP